MHGRFDNGKAGDNKTRHYSSSDNWTINHWNTAFNYPTIDFKTIDNWTRSNNQWSVYYKTGDYSSNDNAKTTCRLSNSDKFWFIMC